jgi:histidinol-phosphate aminotransferase
VVLVDEAYVDFSGGRDGLALAKKLPNVLVCRTMSKSFSWPACGSAMHRFDAGLVGALYKLKDSYNVDRLAQAVALAALDDVPGCRTTRQDRRHPGAGGGGTGNGGFRVVPSAANFLFVEPPAGTGAADLFAELRTKNILVRYFPGGRTGAFCA